MHAGAIELGPRTRGRAGRPSIQTLDGPGPEIAPGAHAYARRGAKWSYIARARAGAILTDVGHSASRAHSDTIHRESAKRVRNSVARGKNRVSVQPRSQAVVYHDDCSPARGITKRSSQNTPAYDSCVAAGNAGVVTAECVCIFDGILK